MSDYKFDGIALGLSILVGLAVAGLSVYLTDQYKTRHEPKVLTEEQVKQPETVAKKIHVTQPEAQTIVHEIEKSSGSTPSVTYYVKAPTLDKAAKTTAEKIEKQDPTLPVKALEKADRTVVTPDEKLKKVDVYKISLRKAHKLKTGISYVNDKSYFTAGYQAGRFEGLAYLDWSGKPKGESLLYTAYEW